MLKWWERYGPGHPDIVDVVRCQLCAQASSATSERAFSKMGLIISKKRQQLASDHVNSISLMGLEVAKLFLNLWKLGIPNFSVLFFPFFSIRIFPWWQNRFPSSFSNVPADWEANSGWVRNPCPHQLRTIGFQRPFAPSTDSESPYMQNWWIVPLTSKSLIIRI